MTVRLSISSLAGTARTLVAVGTSNDMDMFLTTAAAAPRSTWYASPSAGVGAGAAGLAGALVAPFPGEGAVGAGGDGAGTAADWAGGEAASCPSALAVLSAPGS